MRIMEDAKSGLLVTNHLNLMFSLAAGLIMPPSGFGDKYYKDTLGEYPGWIPLFIDKVPRGAIDLSTEEASHLMPVIVEIDRTDLTGMDLGTARDGVMQRSLFPDFDDSAVRKRGLIVRGPIPTAIIRRIYVR